MVLSGETAATQRRATRLSIGICEARNPAWGVRDLEAVAALAEADGFAQPVVEEMPANNLSVIFLRQPP